MKHTYLLMPPCLAPPLLLNVPEVTTDKISTPTVQILMTQTRGHKTESHQISIRCTEITGDYSAESCNQNCDPSIRFQAPT